MYVCAYVNMYCISVSDVIMCMYGMCVYVYVLILSDIEVYLSVLVTNNLSRYTGIWQLAHNSCQYILHTVTHRCYKTDIMNYCGSRKPINIVTYITQKLTFQ